MHVVWYFVIGVLAYLLWSIRAKPVSNLPTPPWVPFFGNLFELIKNKDTIYETLLCRMHTDPTYGDGGGCKSFAWALPGGPPNIIMHPSEANYRHILKDKFDIYDMPTSRKEAFKELFGGGIFAVHGREWQLQRKAAASIFTVRLMRDSMTEVLQKHAEIVCNRLKTYADAGKPLDLQDLYFRFTMDSFSEIAFGEELNCLTHEQPHPFSVSFDKVQNGVMDRMIVGPLFWKTARLLNIGRERIIRENLKILNDQAYLFVKRRRDDIEKGVERHDLISNFLTAAKKEGTTYTDEQMRDTILNFMIAGRDTTACALSWMSYELTQHPKCMAAVVEEIDRVIGRTAHPTYDTVADLRYTEAVLLETLRLHPSVPADSKMSLKDDVLPDGTVVPAGTDIMYNPYLGGRAKCMWGEDALEFKPERWLTEDAKGTKGAVDEDDRTGTGGVMGGTLTKTFSTFKYITFNAGPRLCLGRGLALMEAKLLISMILQRFTFEPVPNQDVTFMVTITLMLKNGFKVIPRHRSAAA